MLLGNQVGDYAKGLPYRGKVNDNHFQTWFDATWFYNFMNVTEYKALWFK